MILALLLSVRAVALPAVVDDALAYASTDRARAIAVLEQALTSGVSGGDLDTVMLYAGEQRRLSGDTAAARRWFEQVAAGSPASIGAKLGKLLLDAGNPIDDAERRALASASAKAIPATQDADRHLLLALDAAQRNDAGAAADHSRAALAAASGDPDVQARVAAALAAVAKGGNGTADPLARAEQALAEGRKEDARRSAQSALSSAPAGSPTALAAAALLRRIDAPPADANRIAVLLPLSGKYEGVGRQILEALREGYEASGGNRALLGIDTGGSPTGAVAGLERAALTERAIAVVGPLLSDETAPVLAASDALHIPLISLSQSVEDPTAHPWLLQGVPTRSDQTDFLVTSLARDYGYRRFAVFAPDNAYGKSASEALASSAARSGSSVAATVMFPSDAKDLVPHGAKLRKAVKDADYDALFLPQNARDLPFACAALAFNEFPMGEFLPYKDKSPYRPVVGLSSWNSREVVTNGGQYLRTGHFVDVFSPGIGSSVAVAWSQAFKAEYGRTPSALEASAYDVGRLLGMAARGPAADRAAFLQALLDVEVADTITGAGDFDATTRRATSDLVLYTVGRDAIRVATPGPPPIP